jgi:hypothetical protein
MSSDTDKYGKSHETVDLGAFEGQGWERVPGAKPDGQAAHAIAESASPKSKLEGGSDPKNIGPGPVKMGMR